MSDVHVSFASKLISEGHGTRLGKYSLGKVSPRSEVEPRILIEKDYNCVEVRY